MPPVPTVRPDGPLIRKLREERFYNGVMFARKIGCHPKVLYRIETDSPLTGIDLMRRIARGLDIDVRVIVRLEPDGELTAPCPHCGAGIDVYALYAAAVLTQGGDAGDVRGSAAA